MSHHVLSVCIFCFICATHTPCASHAAIKHPVHNKDFSNPVKLAYVDKFPRDVSNSQRNNDEGFREKRTKRSDEASEVAPNDSESDSDRLKKIFSKYGNGEVMTQEGFKRFLDDLSAPERRDAKENCTETDVIPSSLGLGDSEGINETSLYNVCPFILYNLVNKDCTAHDGDHAHGDEENSSLVNNGFVWLCSILAILLISACGVLSLAIIPVMQKRFYKPLIQFLVALAVGTLAGDAFLHLLPHSMSTTHHHSHSHRSHEEDTHTHDENIQKGCVAMLGLTFFFAMEKVISITAKWRKGKQKHQHSHVTVINERRDSGGPKNETQCMDKYNSYPYCYKDIMDNPRITFLESDRTATTVLDHCSNSGSNKLSKSSLEVNNQNADCPSDLKDCTEANKMLTPEHKANDDYTVIVREHKSDHHGHSHKHGHVHAAPKNLSSVAWMVIMGDGLHNFTDGMAIGAAFSGSLAGGFSTTVAVFCHELPHELGDFAMLLKAGMTIKQALFYNILSSILCVIGNVFGLVLGNTEYASSWVFAAAAGMFIYIALVDMIPELSSAHEDEGNVGMCLLHLGGLLNGLGIMALIAVYEHDLMNVFSEAK
ncbi:unnamed protein product [Phyllotreta striolata]|uniref:Zinc transporter foi n=1 Tax=Phyllotreta striolata TaxID=444603 RepID=A0A9N9TYI1_PHYSR|nr:unnamed protein product [Phyllotreta striolata]